MSYGIDFKKRVISHVKLGHTKKETCQLFGISTNTLYLWEKQLEKEGHLNRKPRALSPRKLPLDLLENDVKEHPDAYLREIAEQFWAVLKRTITDLLKQFQSIQECLEYYFKAK